MKVVEAYMHCLRCHRTFYTAAQICEACKGPLQVRNLTKSIPQEQREEQQQPAKQQQRKERRQHQPRQDSGVQFCLDVVLKEAKEEETLGKQLIYTKLSAYSNNPVNIAVNAPPGTGKSYTIMRVKDLFPSADVVLYAGMTPKALFHRQGELVAQDENTGQYVSIEDKLSALDAEIEEKQLAISAAEKKEQKAALRKEKAELEKKRSELLKNAKKLIDLSHKILIFLDTPPTSLFEAIMPLLSHDAYEVEYDYVDTNNGIKTKSNILRGWPAVIFAQAIDSSDHKRWPEIQRRFVVTNPKQSDTKIKAAIELTTDKLGLPDVLYQEAVVSDAEKDMARSKIEALRSRMLDASKQSKPGKNNVFVPFRKTIKESLPRSEALDMTVANRFFTWLTLIAVVESHKRPLLVLHDAATKPTTAVIATFEDLEEAQSLMEYSNGVRPYVLDWFNEVFLAAYAEKQDGVTTKDLADWTKEKRGRRVSREAIRKSYCEPLYNAGYLDKEENKNNMVELLYTPVKTNQGTLFQDGMIEVKDATLYPDRANLTKWIKEAVKEHDADILAPAEGNVSNTLTVQDLVTQFFSQPEGCFRRRY